MSSYPRCTHPSKDQSKGTILYGSGRDNFSEGFCQGFLSLAHELGLPDVDWNGEDPEGFREWLVTEYIAVVEMTSM